MVDDVFGIVGTTLANTFMLEEVIAEGGFGVVYRAEHVAFRAPVALKCLKVPGTITPEQSESFIENFREEAEILFHLSAQIPEVVRPLHADAMTLPDGTFVPFIAMEWIEGQPLDSIIILRDEAGKPPLSLRKTIKMLTPIAHALARAHQFEIPGGGVVSVTHCDLKPENILITEPDNPARAKILDFGIAKARDMVRLRVGKITDTEGANPFTPSYGAPEQWVPKRYGQSGPWTDVWGLALTLVECVTGQPPIDGDMHAMMGTALDRSRRPTPRTEGINVSDEVEQVFARALAVDPRDRYNEIEAFWTDLERAHGVPSSFARVRRRAASDPPDDGESKPPEAWQPSGATAAQLLHDSSDSLDRYDSGEFPLATESSDRISLDDRISPPPADVSGSFDLDVDVAIPKPRPAATSGAWPQAPSTTGGFDAARSDRFPAARSGRFDAAPMSRPLAALPDTPVGLGARLKTPIILVIVGLVVIAADLFVARTTGAPIALGPVKLRWLAVALAVVGVAMAFWSLTSDRDE